MSFRILVVDDNPDCRSDIRWRLEKSLPDCQVTEAENDIDARRWLVDATFDVVVADIKLDEGGGAEFGGLLVLQAALEKDPTIAVILITAQSGKLARLQEQDGLENVSARDYVIKLGAFNYIDKSQPGVNYLDAVRASVLQAAQSHRLPDRAETVDQSDS